MSNIALVHGTASVRGKKRPAPEEERIGPVQLAKKVKQEANSTHVEDASPQSAKRDETLVFSYEPAKSNTPTPLCERMRQLGGSSMVVQHNLKSAHYALLQLGQCASDLVWRRFLQETEGKYQPNADRSILEIIRDHTFTLPNISLDSPRCNVTPKFSELIGILQSLEPQQETFRGLIFVKRRCVALALGDMIRNMNSQLGFLRLQVLTNNSKGTDAKHLTKLYDDFKKGTYNLIVATRSAEDLDLPGASVIINFDLPEGLLSYSYALSNVREGESCSIFMVERGNNCHRSILSELSRLRPRLVDWTPSIREMLVDAPPPIFDELPPPYYSDSDDEDTERIIDPTTSHHITSMDSTAVVYAYVSRNKHEDDKAPPLFTIQEHPDNQEHERYSCTLTLPRSPVGLVSGTPSPLPAIARRSACYQACVELFVSGHLDFTYFPLPLRSQSSTPLAEETLQPSTNDDKNENGSRRYPRKIADFWINIGSSSSEDFFYPTIISPSADGSLLHSPMLIITRHPLPLHTKFTIFGHGIPSEVQLTRGASFMIPEGKLGRLHQYTLRICKTIVNRPLSFALDEMPYFFAPLKRGVKIQGNPPQVSQHISWDQITEAADSWASKLHYEGGNLAEELDDAILADMWVEFTRRYDNAKVRADLTPMSKPEGRKKRDEEFDTYVDYCKARRKGFQGLKDYSQPLLEATKLTITRNCLSPLQPWDATEGDASRCFIPELCAKFPIPASTLRTAQLLPSILRRIDDLLVVKELNTKLFGRAISEDLLLVAITAPSAGLAYDYERLELLGDAFLKYISSLYVYTAYPDYSEGKLHSVRQKIISNKLLCQTAQSIGLPPYIQSKPFNIRLWKPVYPVDEETHPIEKGNLAMDDNLSGQAEGSSLAPGQKSKKRSKKRRRLEEQYHSFLGDKVGSIDLPGVLHLIDVSTARLPLLKVVADVAEAVLGAAFLSGGRETALDVAKALNLPFTNLYCWSDLDRKAKPANTAVQLRTESISAVEEIIGHKFAHRGWLAQALTHSSAQGANSSYERLEFIGDAILDFMVVCYLFDKYPNLSPAGLTMLKGAMVCNSALAAICVASGLSQHIIWGTHNAARHAKLKAYLDLLNTRRTQEYRAAELAGRPYGQYWLDVEPPKALSDVVESIIGAIYLSETFQPSGSQNFFDCVLKPFYDDHVTLKTLAHHPTKVLVEYLQAQGCHEVEIETEHIDGLRRCYVIIHDTILAFGEDVSAAQAARHASSSALDALEVDTAFILSTCSCRLSAQQQRKKRKDLKEIFSGFGEGEDDVLAEMAS